MKILYGVQGTGNGHISRARLMADAFSRRNDVEVDYLF
jgi:UDP:flavonoid glycosyltransferase YjiC (YdhE family)